MFLLPFTPFTHRQLVSEISLPFNGELLLIIPVCALALSLLSLRWLLTRKRAAVRFSDRCSAAPVANNTPCRSTSHQSLTYRYASPNVVSARHAHPHVIQTEELFNRPLEAYEAALHEHGPIIGVRRKGRVRYFHPLFVPR